MEEFFKWQKITDFKVASKVAKYGGFDSLDYIGTVKIHGCNSGILFRNDGEIKFQSRNRMLTIQSDNFEFAFAMTKKLKVLQEFKEDLILHYCIPDRGNIWVIGEYAGKGIQKNVAVSTLDRKFFIFAIF